MKTLLTAIAFLCILLGTLLCLSTACERLSARLAIVGLGLLVGTVALAVWLGWPAV
jgi:hypothetical protein